MIAIAGNTELFCLINERPIVSTVRDLARISLADNVLQLPSYTADGARAWTEVRSMGAAERARGLHLVLDDGTWLQCASDHRLLHVGDGEAHPTSADQLHPGDTVLQLRRFTLPTVISSAGIDRELGALIGWYLAEGSILADEDGIRLSMNADEQDQAEQLIALVQQRFGLVGRILL